MKYQIAHMSRKSWVLGDFYLLIVKRFENLSAKIAVATARWGPSQSSHLTLLSG